jgi:hypothetical protein
MKAPSIKLLAYYHLIGGALGCFLSVDALAGTTVNSTNEALVYGAATLLFLFSAYIGYVGLKGSARSFTKLAIPYQLLQSVTFSFDQLVAYKFFSGLSIVIGAPLNDLLLWRLTFNLSTFFVGWERPMESFVGINLVALLMIYWIMQHRWSGNGQATSSVGSLARYL